MTDERPPNKRQLQAAATRERMLAAARDVFETRGYRSASVGAITAQADTAHGTFYLYFKNKDDAFAQVMAAIDEEFRAAQRARLAASGDDPRHGIEGALTGFLEVFLAHPGLWRALLEGMLLSDTVERMWLDTRARMVGRLVQRLERDQETGLVRPLDTHRVAEALGSMAEWYAFTHLVVSDHGDDPDEVERAVEVLADLWYHAVYGPAVS